MGNTCQVSGRWPGAPAAAPPGSCSGGGCGGYGVSHWACTILQGDCTSWLNTLTDWWRLAKGREEKTSGVRPNTKYDRCLHRPPEFVVSRLSSRVFFRGICLPACLPPRFVVSVRSGRWIHVIFDSPTLGGAGTRHVPCAHPRVLVAAVRKVSQIYRARLWLVDSMRNAQRVCTGGLSCRRSACPPLHNVILAPAPNALQRW